MKNRKIQVIYLLIGMMSMAYSVHAQLLGGFFNQKGTQRKYMLEQIALYQGYLGYVKKGYDQAKTGLNTISAIRNGEFHLHQDHFSSLQQVNPAIKKQEQVNRILNNEQQARIILSSTIQRASGSNLLTSQEIAYCHRVADNMDKECSRDMDELEMIIKPGKLQMTDDERLRKINTLYKTSQDKYVFACSFAADIQMMMAQRKQELSNIATSRKLFQLP